MKGFWGKLSHIVAIGGQTFNAYGGLIPHQHQPKIAVGLSLAQFVIGQLQHSSNPDGTPATEPYKGPTAPPARFNCWLVLLGLLIAAPGLLFGQQKAFQVQAFKNAGESISLRWAFEYRDETLQGWRLYRGTETGSRTLIATGGPATRAFTTNMPGGSSRNYFYTVRPVSAAGTVGPGVEFLVTRK